MGAASADMASYYGLPCASWVSTESMVEDAQSALEKMMGFQMHVGEGVDLMWGMGQLESQLSISAEQLIIDDEIVARVMRAREGIVVDADHLASGVMETVGLDGDFLSHPHTLEWFRSGLRAERLGNRTHREGWTQSGRRDLRGLARDRLEELLSGPEDPALDEAQDRELARIESHYLDHVSN